MKSPENSVRRPPALVENPGFYAVVLCCSFLFCAVVFVSARKAVRYCVNVAKPRPKRQKSLEPAKEKTEQQCLIINKKKSSETFHSIYVERGFLKMQQQLSVGLVYP